MDCGIFLKLALGYVRANLELVKRYLKTDTSCIAAVHVSLKNLYLTLLLLVSSPSFRKG